MNYILIPLFLIFALIEYQSGGSLCSVSNLITGNMWFMWIMMTLMCLDRCIQPIYSWVAKLWR